MINSSQYFSLPNVFEDERLAIAFYSIKFEHDSYQIKKSEILGIIFTLYN